MGDPFYKTARWKRLRAARLKLDKHTCVIAGCGERATHVDHVIRRRDGGSDTLDNLRSLCAFHDSQVKERADGKRANDGKATVRGCDADGFPIDPNHPWNRPAGDRSS